MDIIKNKYEQKQAKSTSFVPGEFAPEELDAENNNVDETTNLVFDVACLKYPSVYQKDVENDKVSLRYLVCDEIVGNIQNSHDVVRHMNQLRYKEEAELKAKKDTEKVKLDELNGHIPGDDEMTATDLCIKYILMYRRDLEMVGEKLLCKTCQLPMQKP